MAQRCFFMSLHSFYSNYQKLERPVAEESKPLELKFGLSLQQIVDLDERNQLLKTNMWLNYWWTDANLMWKSVKAKHTKVA